MAMDQNNNRAVVRRLARRSVRTGGRTSLLTAVTIALTAMLATALVLQATGLVNSQKKTLERAQQAIYMNLTEVQRRALEADERMSSTIASKSGLAVKVNGVLVQPCYYAPGTDDMDSVALAEGRMAEAMDEVVVDKATLRAFGLPEALGVSITVPFLNSEPEIFTVVGLTDYEQNGVKLNSHRLTLARSYAENGLQLKAEPWYLMARLKGGAEMNGPELKEMLYRIGEEHGIAYQNVNPNDYYIKLRTTDSLMVLTYLGASALLVAVSLLVIYSIFYLSVAGRVRQFGQLRTIGMTAKQLRRMVRQEGWLLWALGTPAGFVLGSLFMLAFGPQNGWGLNNNLLALAASAAVCALAVRLGVQKPAGLAAKASPIEAARFQSWQGQKQIKGAAPRALTPWGLARLNFVRGWKKQLLTLLSLAVGGTMFMAAAIYVEGWDLEAYSRQAEWKDGEYVIIFDYNAENSLENGASALQLQGMLGKGFQSELLALPGVESVKAYHGVVSRFRWEDIDATEEFTPIERENAGLLQKNLVEGTGDYDELVASGGVYVAMQGMWKEINGKAPKVGDEIEFTYYNGETRTVRLPVVGVGSNEVRDDFTACSWFIIPRETANALFGGMDTTRMLSVAMENDSHTPAQDEQMRAFMADYPQLDMGTLNARMEADAASYAVMKAVFIGIGGFIVLFSLVNLLNTMLAGLMTRRQQLALLAALGMTRRQIARMLGFENLLTAGVNLAATAAMGSLAGWGICQLMAVLGADYMQFTFPLFWFLSYGVVAAGAPALITRVCLKSFYKESLTERLRTTE